MGATTHLPLCRTTKRSGMTDSTVQFQIQQLRLKNIWKELEFIAVIVMVIFVNGLLPQLLLQYVYAEAELFETPQALILIPVISFVIGVLMFIYVGVGNLRREMQARQLEMSMVPQNGATLLAPSNTSTQFQAAMKSLETKTKTQRVTPRKSVKLATAKPATKAARAKKTTTRRKSK